MNITITGGIGSGKSTVARVLRDGYGYRLHSSGTVLRAMAREAGMSIADYQAIVADNPDIDIAIDRAIAGVRSWSRTCFDSRVGFAFADEPHFRVLLTCPEELAAKRVLDAGRADESYPDLQSAKVAIARRQDAERQRYLSLYNVDPLDPELHDCVISVGEDGAVTPEEIASRIVASAEAYAADLEPGKIIDAFRGEWRFLSNMHECSVMLDGRVFGSSEAAYHSLKFDDPPVKDRLAAARDGKEAKRIAESLSPREGWPNERVHAMRTAVEAKFAQNAELGARLVGTIPYTLVEGNDWGDNFFGHDRSNADGPHLNMLGRVLMDTRFKLAHLQ